MKRNYLLLLVFGLILNLTQAQNTKEISKLKLFDEEKPSNATSKYLGKIVFANSEIKKDDSDSKYISTYTFGDKLYIKSFLLNSISNSVLIQLVDKGLKAKDVNKEIFNYINFASAYYKLYIDGKEVTKSEKGRFGDASISGLNIMNCINDGINNGTDGEQFAEKLYSELLNHPELLIPGNHKMKIEMVLLCPRCPSEIATDKILAVGEIDMIIPDKIKVTENDCFPNKQLSDIKLETEALKCFKNRKDAYKVILTDRDYTIVKNEYGIPLRKCFIAAVVFKNGNDVTYEYVVFEKVFDGVNYQNLKIGDQLRSLPERLTPKGKKVNADCLKYLK